MLFVLLSFAINKDRSPEAKIFLGKYCHNLYFDNFLIMVPVRVLVLSHSFIHRLHTFLLRNFNAHIAANLSLPGDLQIRWHGTGGRTVPKTIRFDLHVVEEFAPNIVIQQLGTNDLTTTSAAEPGSAIEDLVGSYTSHTVLKWFVSAIQFIG